MFGTRFVITIIAAALLCGCAAQTPAASRGGAAPVVDPDPDSDSGADSDSDSDSDPDPGSGADADAAAVQLATPTAKRPAQPAAAQPAAAQPAAAQPAARLGNVTLRVSHTALIRTDIAQGIPHEGPPPTRTHAQIRLLFHNPGPADARIAHWSVALRDGKDERPIAGMNAYLPIPGMTQYWDGTVAADSEREVIFGLPDNVAPPALVTDRDYRLVVRLTDDAGHRAYIESEPVRLVVHGLPPGGHRVPSRPPGGPNLPAPRRPTP